MDASAQQPIRLGGAEFEPLSGRLLVAGVSHRLRPQTAAVLHVLLVRKNQLVLRDDLVQAVWGDVLVTENSLAQCISEIRGALQGASVSVETVPRRGYCLRDDSDSPPNATAVPTASWAPPEALASRTVAKWTPRSFGLLGVGLLGVVAFAMWAGVVLLRPAPPAALSMAVLPFATRTSQPDTAWFRDAVGEDLTTYLSRIPGSRVIAWASAKPYGERVADLPAVARELGVRYLVTGTVDRQADQVGLDIQLVEAASGTLVWAARHDTPANGLSEAEGLLVRQLAHALHVRVVDVDARRLTREASPQAHELGLQAWAFWNRGSPEDIVRARDLAEAALAHDPDEVLALKTLASWHLRARLNQSMPAAQAVAGAMQAAQRAMELDPFHPLVHTVYGGALTFAGRYDEAQQALLLEIANNPSHPVAYTYLGLDYLMRGLPESAAAQYRKAIDISPNDPRLSRFYRYLALSHLHMGDVKRAQLEALQSTQVRWVDRSAWPMLAAVCALAEDVTCTRRAVAKVRETWPGYTTAAGEAEWPPLTDAFRQQHAAFIRGMQLAGLSGSVPAGPP